MSNTNYSYTTCDKNFFDAILKDDNNQFLELGKACISLENQSIDFVNEFVPLMKFKSKAKIIKLVNGTECHCFSGTVYLSSKTRLQLSSVSDSLISFEELCIPKKVQITGIVHNRHKSTTMSSISIDIFSLSLDEVAFSISKETILGQQLLLEIQSPISLNSVALHVYKQLQFSIDKTVYYATMDYETLDSKSTMIEFLSKNIIVFP